MTPELSAATLDIDAAAVVDEIAGRLRETVRQTLGKRGAVLGVSGGIDSSVGAALSVHALGAENVLGISMPESESESESLQLPQVVGEHLGIEVIVEDIGPILDAAGCYRRRDDAIRSVAPEYGPDWLSKIVLPSVQASGGIRRAAIVVESPKGERSEHPLSAAAYRTVVAATSFKQRTRKMIEYFHADRLDYAVIGTPNLLEFDQGFFVKNGDGSADVKPIAHLYKTQVYALADYLELPAAVRDRSPTTDTYGLPQTQEEFFFGVPLDVLDLCLYAHNAGIPAEQVAHAVSLDAAEVERVFRDIEQKRRVARYLHLAPQLVG